MLDAVIVRGGAYSIAGSNFLASQLNTERHCYLFLKRRFVILLV